MTLDKFEQAKNLIEKIDWLKEAIIHARGTLPGGFSYGATSKELRQEFQKRAIDDLSKQLQDLELEFLSL